MSGASRRERARRRAGRRGYTLMESVAAIGVLAVGATGVVAMQKAALIGNTNARNLSTANAIAATWAERLRADGMLWNDANGVPDLTDTRWLQAVNTAPGVWLIPTEFPGVASPDADVLGADLFTNEAAPAFCTHLRLTQMYPTMIRAEIRVFWEKAGMPLPVNCAVGIDTVTSSNGRYGYVYLTTGILQTSAM